MNSEIKKIEKQLKKEVSSADHTLNDTSHHLLDSGGKRVRPLFVILSSQFGTKVNDESYRVAVALELIHMATLVHDDVIDKSDKRRGRPTIVKKWDQPTAILTGNFLLARALEYISSIDNQAIHTTLSKAIVEVCRGELFQFEDQFNGKQTITNYLRRINRKTALLIQLATELGAMSSHSTDETVYRLKMIGHYIGMSFQIVDDILDFTSTEKALGKPVGSDLMNGHITLPVLLEMRKDANFKARIEALHAESEPKEFDAIIKRVRQSASIDESKAISQRYLDKAIQLLNELEDNHAKVLIEKLIHRMGKRTA
nr:polyprenyl synthetase family protein [Staphylococcus massiliensis]